MERDPEAAERTFGDRFWDRICGYAGVWYAMFVLGCVLLALQLLALFGGGITPGSASYVVSTINLVVLIVTVAGTAFVSVRCRN